MALFIFTNQIYHWLRVTTLVFIKNNFADLLVLESCLRGKNQHGTGFYVSSRSVSRVIQRFKSGHVSVRKQLLSVTDSYNQVRSRCAIKQVFTCI